MLFFTFKVVNANYKNVAVPERYASLKYPFDGRQRL